MVYRYLGKECLKVSAIGYGCPPFQGKLSDSDEQQAIAVLQRAIGIGMNFIDTADHNNGNNEELLAKVLNGKRSAVVLTSKFGNLRGQPWAEGRRSKDGPSMSRGRVRIHCADCGPTTSISIIFIVSIPKCRSKKLSAP